MEDLAIGELVIMQKAHHFSRWNGALGVVVELRSARTALDLSIKEKVRLDAYRVRVLDTDGIEVICERYQLRKLRDPDDAASTEQLKEREKPEPEMAD